jgi:aminoglycoside phosphotransferase family enzyme
MTEEFGTGDLIGSGRVADVVARGTNVIKLYREGLGKLEAFREAAILSVLEDADLHTPSVQNVGKFGERWGLEMSRAPGSTISLSGETLGVWMAGLHWRLHQIRGIALTSLKLKLARNIQRALQLENDDRAKLLLRLRDLPDDDCLCHGDFHPANIMGSEAEPHVVDWLDATSGPAQADACRTYLLALHHAPELARSYLAAYEKASSCSTEQILRWLPIVAAARLSENIADEVPRLLAHAKAVN